MRPKIAILGAGLMGRMLAVSLMEDYQVELFDRDCGDAKQSAAYLAAAMLAPLAESADCSKEIMQLGARALQQWPDFLSKLTEPVFFQKKGSLVLAFEQDLGDLELFKSRLKGDEYELINSLEIKEIEPGVNARFNAGLLLPNEGQLDNRGLLLALSKTLKDSGVVWHKQAQVTRVTPAGESPMYHCEGHEFSQFDWIFDCRGLGAKEDAMSDNQVNKPLAQLRGVRGEVIRLHAPNVTLSRPVRLMHPRYPIYIAPKEAGVFVVGATQIESEDSRKPTVKSALELLSACFSVHRGFAEAEILAIESGCRPAYWDNEPKIKVSGNIVSVNGLFRHGYLLAPVMVEQCLHLLKGTEKSSVVTKIMPLLMVKDG
ncbi:MAG: FAD-dependent oxidoreductase [Gammaproteobacteria bacterium]|nr:FAD-dependent oxidoreductase [Gammaproteobacteria bacterium]